MITNFLEGDSTGFLKKYRDALKEEFDGLKEPFPAVINPTTRSARLADLLKTLCKSYMDMKLARKGEKYCDELLRMDGYESDIDGLVGKGEALLIKEEFEEAARVFDKAFEASGRSSQDVRS